MNRSRIDLARIDELARRLTEVLPPPARIVRVEAEARFKALLRKGLEERQARLQS